MKKFLSLAIFLALSFFILTPTAHALLPNAPTGNNANNSQAQSGGTVTCPQNDPSCSSPSGGSGGTTGGGGTAGGSNGGTLNCSQIDPNLQDINGTCVPKRTFTCTNTSLSLACVTSLGQGITIIVRILLILAGVAAVIVIIYGGYLYMFARGNTEAAGKGQKAVTQAITGLILIILAYTIVQVITTSLISGRITPGGP